MNVNTPMTTTVVIMKTLVSPAQEKLKEASITGLLEVMRVPSHKVSSASLLIQMEMDGQVVLRPGTTITGELSVTTSLMRTTTLLELFAATSVCHPLMHTTFQHGKKVLVRS